MAPSRRRRAGPGGTRETRRNSREPERRCIVSRDVRPKAEMIRFVVGPEGNIVPDVDGRLPGRGLWLSADRDMLDTARSKGLFAKAAKRNVTVPEDLGNRVEALLARRCLHFLGLARRAGEAVAGFEKVRGWLGAGKVAVLLAARDGAEGGKAKLGARARDTIFVDLFTSTELGSAMGRGGVVHLALARGGLADAFLAETGRLAGFRRAFEQ